MHNPLEHHLGTTKHVLRCIREIRNFGIWCELVPNFKFLDFTDSDLVCSKMIGRAQADLCSILDPKRFRGVQRSKQTWCYHILKQNTLLPHLLLVKPFECGGFRRHKPSSDKGHRNFCDNKATISMTKKLVFHGRTEYIELRHHFIRDDVVDSIISMKHCSMKEQVVDGLTKALNYLKSIQFQPSLGVADFASRGNVVS